MQEHRLIERMINILKKEMAWIRRGVQPNTRLIDQCIDFFRNYADRCHEGKEEFILFRELAKKSLLEEHRNILNELIQEHIEARSLVNVLEEANHRFLIKGDRSADQIIISTLNRMTSFYPKHIEKEDNQLFNSVLDYFNQNEIEAMLREFDELEKRIIHDKYNQIVSEWELTFLSEGTLSGEK